MKELLSIILLPITLQIEKQRNNRHLRFLGRHVPDWYKDKGVLDKNHR